MKVLCLIIFLISNSILLASSETRLELDQLEKDYLMGAIGADELKGKDLSKIESYQDIMTKMSKNGSTYSSYSPTLFSLTGVSYSISFERKHRFQKIKLKMPKAFLAQAHYQKAMTIYYQKPKREHVNPKLFVLLQGSFSNFKDGRQINQTIHYLNEIYDQPAIIVLDGYATKETYRSKPKFPVLSGKYYGRDVYLRLRTFIRTLTYFKEKKTKVGVIGYSGGASFLWSLLKEDEVNSGEGNEIFNLGGLSFSPTVRLKEVEVNLDGYWDLLENQGISLKETITGYYMKKVLSNPLEYLFNKEKFLPKPDDFFKLLTNETTESEFLEWEKRFYNQFRFSAISPIAKAFNQEESILNYKSYYDYAFSEHQKQHGYTGESFDEYTNMLDVMPDKLPVYIIFTLDDPVLQNPSFHKDLSVSNETSTILKDISAKENVRLFTPNWGGHLGYLMDDSYVKNLIRIYFQK